ncbi:MAG: hypothetical protein IT446_01320 [Phycisphaerales bacterium]|nr:hypothetical protein [Phycisphaerales bacterium]
MPDDPKPKRNLSEISHLFLSSVRDRQTHGASRPQRTPPPRPDVSIDLTAEEFAQVYGNEPAPDPQNKIAPVTALIGAHLNGRQFDRAREVARHLAASGTRVGLIEVDASEFRLMCFDRGVQTDGEGSAADLSIEPRQMSEALYELNWDVDQWLLLLPNPRIPEARTLLRDVDHWSLLTTCDHDGIVSSYRTLKGLADLHHPALSLVMLDAQDEQEASRVSRKITSVCRQFMNWAVESEQVVKSAPDVSEHTVLVWRPTRDKAQMAAGPQWQIVAGFLAKAKSSPRDKSPQPAVDQVEPAMHKAPVIPQMLAEVVIPTAPTPKKPAVAAIESAPIPMRPTPNTPSAGGGVGMAGDSDVIELPADDSESDILQAFLQHTGAEWVQCPVRAPNCPQARLAVGRDHAVTLLAVASHGLADLRHIGEAYRWLIENRALISMAMPQLSIDAHQHPRLRLLVEQADRGGELLQPLLQSGSVTVQSYRKLRWGGRRGLLLEAA